MKEIEKKREGERERGREGVEKIERTDDLERDEKAQMIVSVDKKQTKSECH